MDFYNKEKFYTSYGTYNPSGEKKYLYSFNHKYVHHININTHFFISLGYRVNKQPCKKNEHSLK